MTTTASATPVAATDCGLLRGTTERNVAVFRAVPYAAPPVGALRFAPPQPPQSWTGERDATAHGPIAPQPPSRLRGAMGDFTLPQSEDCLTLTIWTPAADNRRRPVLLWLHGGAFMSGAGSLDWYSGAALAGRGDIVVVGVNYRLGALGFMHLPGVSPPNLGLLDQFAALEWVRRNAAAFGGDPDAITVAGQSAGAFSVLAMLGVPAVRAQFRRAIIQSAPFGRVLRTAEAAAANGRKLGELLGVSSAEEWRAVPTADIVAGTVKLAVATAAFANAMPPFTPIGDGALLGGNPVDSALAGAVGRDVLVGHTRDEMAAFFAIDDRVKNAPPEAVAGRFRDFFGAAADEAIAEYRQRARGDSTMALLGEMIGDATFCAGTFEFADRLADLGRPAHVFRFDWAAPGNMFGACHCSELPFMFGNLDNWPAPMSAGGDAAAKARLADQMQDAWIAFVRTGDPAHGGLPAWPRYGAGRETMLFDTPSRVAGDPAGRRRWHYWP